MRYRSRGSDGAVIMHSLSTSIGSTFYEYADLVFIPYVLFQLQQSIRVDKEIASASGFLDKLQ